MLINWIYNNSTAAAETLAKDIESKCDVTAILAQCDITAKDGLDQLIGIAKSSFIKEGRFQIHILINNAGVVNPAPMGSATHEDFDNTFKLNARAPLFVIQAAMPYLPSDRSGRIVNVSSITTSMGFWWQSCYAGTKGALEAMVRILDKDYVSSC